MSKLAHLYRRKALYYWRRRLPPPLRSWFHKRHLFLSLRTADPTFARSQIDRNYDPYSPVHLLGNGDLTEKQKKKLTADEKAKLENLVEKADPL